MIEKAYSVIVMSPLSEIGCGRQLAATSDKTSAAVVRNGMLWDVVFLMRIASSLNLGQTKKPLRLIFCSRGLHVYTTELGLEGIGLNADISEIRVISGLFL
jgi:hypothetical protein